MKKTTSKPRTMKTVMALSINEHNKVTIRIGKFRQKTRTDKKRMKKKS